MENVNIFELASRRKFRFKAQQGLVSTEDLWSLQLTVLDELAKGLRKELRETEESFIEKSTTKNVDLEIKFEIVKHIISTRLAEQNQRAADRDKAARKQQIMEIIEQKQNSELLSLSKEELQAMLDKM